MIAAVTVAELRTGIELGGEQHRTARIEFLVRVLETLPIETYDLAVVEMHGRLLAHVHRSGSQRGSHDLIIAATALATKRTLLATDRNARSKNGLDPNGERACRLKASCAADDG